MKNKIFTLIFAFMAISFVSEAQTKIAAGGPTEIKIDASKDIWIEDKDGNKLDQPDCNNNPNYICVRVRNARFYSDSPLTTLKLHWTDAGLTIHGEKPCDGTDPDWPGDLINNVIIPPLKPNEVKEIRIPWDAPCPNSRKFCIKVSLKNSDGTQNGLVLSLDDLNFGYSNVVIKRKYNLNDIQSTQLNIKNYEMTAQTYAMDFGKLNEPEESPNEPNQSIYDKAEVTISFDERLMSAWQRSNGRLINIERLEWNSFRILGEDARFYGLTLMPQEMGNITVSFKFFDYNPDTDYEYHLILWDVNTKKFIGSETFIYYAYDGNNERMLTEPISNKNEIKSISPNPTKDNVLVTYSLEENQSAYLMLTSIDSKINEKYELDSKNNEITINASKYSTGVYTVSLVCNGKIVNSSSFVKE